MNLPAERLYLACRSLLDAVEAYYTANDHPLPLRRYVANGLPAWDCEQVTVYVERTFSGLPNQETGEILECLQLTSAQLCVEVARCVPTFDGDDPAPAAAIEDSAALILADPILILNAAVTAYRAGDLAGCKNLVVADWEPLGPEGGFGGGRQRFRWGLTEV